ncbi:MAG: AMP-binding protein [Caldilineae bacterium]|nr:AMP-binding protein [Chloroflexota bacterium]MCB9176582.1 AMP-binding protein [Caldilineae bacterium]
MSAKPGRLAYQHLGGERPLVGETVDDCFRASVARYPDREAVIALPQARRLSYRELDREVQRLAKGLMAIGVARGDRVGIWSTNTLEWVLLQLATARIGAVLVNINPAYRIAELEHALRLARVQTLCLIPAFRRSDYVDMVNRLCPELAGCAPGALHSERLPELRNVVVYEPEDPSATRRPLPGYRTWPELLDAGEALTDGAIQARATELDFDDTINIQFTSGTTGFPKAVMLSHHNIVNNASQVAGCLRFGPEDKLCVPLPFYHCFGMVLSNLMCFSSGAALVIPAEHFEAGAVLRAVSQERCTALHGVPTMFVAELEHPDFGDCDTSSLRTGIMAGAPCPPELMRKVIGTMGIRDILIAYGMTEASPVTHITRPDDAFDTRVETVGTNLPHLEVKLVDSETGVTLPRGAQGELCFRGYGVMRGYFDNPEATAKTIDPAGWLHSGDLGTMDEAGYVRITGRLKDMIIRGGENIYPAEIEAFFYGHPQVAEIAVFGVPDPRLGEEVGAFVKLHEGERVDPEQLRDFARERIAHYKVPRHIWIVDEFPMTVTGKIQKFRMREMAAERLSAAQAATESTPHLEPA